MNSIRITIEPNNPGQLPGAFKDLDGNYSLDLRPKADFPLSFQHDKEASGENNTVAFNSTFLIEVPATQKNTLLLEDIGNPNIFNSAFWFERTLPAIAWIGNSQAINGFLVITDIGFESNQPNSYEIQVIDGGKFWVEALKSLPINQLDLGTYDFTLANVQAAINDANPIYVPGVENIWYPAVFRGKLLGETELNKNAWIVEDFTPVPFLAFIIEQMFVAIKFTVNSGLFNFPDFRKIGADILENFGYTVEFSDSVAAYVGLNVAQVVNDGQTELVQFENESNPFFDNSSLFDDAVNYSYVSSANILASLSVYLEINSLSLNEEDPMSVRIRLRKNGVALNEQTLNGYDLIYEVNLPIASLFINDILDVQIFNDSGFQVEVSEANAFFRIDTKEYLPRDSVVTLTDFIDGRLMCWDLLKSIIDLFGMKHETNTERRTVTMEPALDYSLWGAAIRPGFYRSTTAKDWTAKINACKSFNRRLSEPKRYFKFEWMEDRTDKFANATKLGEAPYNTRIHEEYFDIKKDLPTLNCSGSENTPIGFFATTRQLNIGLWCEVPCVTDNEIFEGDGITGRYELDDEAQRTLTHSPRIYFMKGNTQVNSLTRFTFEGIDYSTYPMAFQASRFLDDQPNIAFDSVVGAVRGNRIGLFESLHKDYLFLRNLNGITDGFALLNELDITELSFRDNVLINGNEYILKAIENWLANEPEVPTKVKLLLNRLIYSY